MESSAELADVIRGWFASVERADGLWLDRHLSRSPSLRIVGTDPAEWLQGESAVNLLKADLEVLGGKAKIRVNEFEAYREGSVGWGVARPTITLPDGTQVSPRWSGVFHQEDGEWKALQVHASIAISNEAAFGVEFPA